MTNIPLEASTAEERPATAATRRGWLLGAGAATAAAAAAVALPRGAPAPSLAAAAPEPDSKDGYRLTAHVLRYYETAKV